MSMQDIHVRIQFEGSLKQRSVSELRQMCRDFGIANIPRSTRQKYKNEFISKLTQHAETYNSIVDDVNSGTVSKSKLSKYDTDGRFKDNVNNAPYTCASLIGDYDRGQQVIPHRLNSDSSVTSHFFTFVCQRRLNRVNCNIYVHCDVIMTMLWNTDIYIIC